MISPDVRAALACTALLFIPGAILALVSVVASFAVFLHMKD